MATKNYDPSRVTVNVLGVMLQGFAPDTFVEVSRDNNTVDDDAGGQGDVVRVINRDQRGTMKVTLMQSSPSNDYLATLVRTDEVTIGGAGTVGPSALADLNGTTLCDGEESWVMKPADVKYGAKADKCEWSIRFAKLRMFPGGSLV
jgi:hypothetical protein